MIFKAFYSIYSAIPEIGLKKHFRAILHRLRYVEYRTYYRNGIWELHYPNFIIKYEDVPSPAATNYLFFKKFIDRKFDIIIDAGGFIGTYGLFMANKYPDAMIYIFEADPKNYLKIKKNLDLNNLKNVILEPLGLWSKSGILKMNVSNNLSSSLLKYQEEGSEQDVSVVSLDEYFDGICEKLIFLKMNIEGAEISAINGGLTFFNNNKIDLAISTDHYVDGDLTFDRVENILSSLGMQVETLSEGIYINTYSSNIPC
jgi:FkbM family methyltransferase